MKNNQKGFGPITILSVILIFALIGVVSWVTYNKSHNKTTQSTKTAVAQKVTDTALNPAIVGGSTKKSSQLAVKEWGISLIPGGKLPSVTYKLVLNEDGRDQAILTFGDLPQECSGIYRVQRESETYVSNVANTGDEKPTTATKIGGYYYWVSHGQGGCPNDNEKQNQLVKELLGDPYSYQIIAI